MIAAFLPIPSNPLVEMAEHGHTDTHFDTRRKFAIDETPYDVARWWRSLNRCMAVLGLLVIGAVVALVILGVKQGWGQSVR